jgi:dihydrolipoamide dehydrogenase
MYDIAVIGAGWAGFNAAVRAKSLGLKVALIEKDKIGGTCLNRGCIPTKALIHSAKVYTLIQKSRIFGIEVPLPVKMNFPEIQARKDKIISHLRTGMESQIKGMDFFNAEAAILPNNTVKINDKQIQAKSIIIATGSEPIELKGLKFDGKKVLSSDGILDLKEAPGSILIVGGGVIGCEFASFFAACGSRVSIAELTPGLLPGEDKEISRKLETIFKKRGITVSTNTDVMSLDLNSYEIVLVAVGRKPNVKNLGLEKLSVRLERDKVIVDEYLKTSAPGIYAAGDCTGRVMLAHFADYQGRLAAGNITGRLKKSNETNVPNCIFTDPEIASIGMNEEQARGKGLGIKVSKFFFLGSGMAHILNETDGFIKVISDEKTSEILGASIIGPKATELIGIFAVALSGHLTVAQAAEIMFAHPTLSESITCSMR